MSIHNEFMTVRLTVVFWPYTDLQSKQFISLVNNDGAVSDRALIHTSFNITKYELNNN